MSKKHYHGSCHCKAVRFEVDLDLAKGTNRCNCSICWKARAWFALVGGKDFTLVAGEESMGSYAWTPRGREKPALTYRFCKACGVRLFATGDEEGQGGRYYAVHIPSLDDVDRDELAAAPLKYADNLHDKPDHTPEDTRLL